MNILKSCVLLSKKAYKNKKYDCGVNTTKEHWHEIENSAFFTCWVDNNFFIVFRGSNDIKDWIDNLEFAQIKTIKGRKYHKGHYEQYLNLKNYIIDELKNALSANNINKIYFTGHSLGGSLATIAISDLISEKSSLLKDYPNFKNIIASYTFGSNKNMNRKAKNFFNKNISESIRCVNGDDVVPKLPAKYFPFMFYFHVSNKLQLGKKEKWYHPIIHPITNIVGDINDHFKNKYVESVEKYLAKKEKESK